MAGCGASRARGRRFWTWREVIYAFRQDEAPDASGRRSRAYVEMMEAGFTTVGEFHYRIMALTARNYADRRNRRPHRSCRRDERHRPGAAAVLLCARRLRRAAAHARTARFLSISTASGACGSLAGARRAASRRKPSHRAAFSARRRCVRAACARPEMDRRSDPYPRRGAGA